MLKEEQLELMADRVYERVKAVNTAYLERIGERYKQLGEISPTDVSRLTRILQWRTSDVAELQALLSKAMNENIKDVENILEGIAKDNYNFAEPFYEAKGVKYVAYAQNTMLVDYANEIIKQTQGTLSNISKTTAIQSSYIEAIDKAVTASTLGLESYSSSIRSAIREVADAGINQVEYDKNGKGYKRRVDTSVRQNVLSAMKQVNLGSSERIGQQFGNDGWEISYHSNPRPSHRDMGGMRYNLYQFEKKGIGDLLNDYNCLHYKYPVVMGVSQSAYDKKELTELKEKDILKVRYNGKEYDRYEMSQIQRRLETAIRKEKDAAVLASKADNMILRRDAQTTINNLTAQYEEVSKVAGLPTKVERMTVARFRPVKAKIPTVVSNPTPKPKNIKQLSEYASEQLGKSYNSTIDKFDLKVTRFTKNNLYNSFTKRSIVDYDGLNLDVAENFNQQFMKLADEYYSFTPSIRTIKDDMFKNSSVYARVTRNHATAQSDVFINTKLMNDSDYIKKRVGINVSKKRIVNVSEQDYLKYIATHEFTHTMMQLEGMLKNYVGLDTGFIIKARKEIRALFKEYKKEIADVRKRLYDFKNQPMYKDLFKLSDEDLWDYFKKYDEIEKEYFNLLISEYSLQDADEFFAEAFTQVKIGIGDKKYATKVIEVIDKYFKKDKIK